MEKIKSIVLKFKSGKSKTVSKGLFCVFTNKEVGEDSLSVICSDISREEYILIIQQLVIMGVNRGFLQAEFTDKVNP